MRLQIAFLCLLSLIRPAPAGTVAENPALREAAKYYELGRIDKALETCIAALEKDPADENIYAYALEILPEGRSKYHTPLLAITDKAAALKTGTYLYYLGRCKLARGAGQAAAALPNCKKARELDPTAWPVYRELGLTYSSLGDGDRAAETLTQGAELYPGSYKTYYCLAAEYEKQKNTADALTNYRKALELLSASEDSGRRAQTALLRNKIERLSADARSKTAQKKPGATNPAPRAPNPAPKESFADRMKTAEYLTRLGKYEDAAEEYRKAAELFGKTDPMAAFCHLKAGQIYFKLNKMNKAILYYGKALEANGNDLNAMLGLAAAYEAGGEPKKAEAMYARVLKAEPANAKARERLDEISFALLSDSQLLEELRGRGAPDDKKTVPSPEDVNLLKAIRLAERNGAVDYLRAKTSYTKGSIVEKQEPDHVRLILTLAGFKNYRNYLTRDAVNFFEKKNIPLRDIFTLRDLAGRPLFDKGGHLTQEGMRAYWNGGTGVKSWLMRYETVSNSPEDDKFNARIRELLKTGFMEISEPEYLWLIKATDCPEDVLQAPPCGIKMLTAPGLRKYFLCHVETELCYTSAAMILSGLVERYRAGDTWIPETGGTTAFFGTGGGEKRRFCHNGRIWNGGDVPRGK
ncbi:MAG: hypothetical protein A2X28_05400 [Elusimicrobia bacterium GWA2_56_46]|nr:MAG: hypothetical protein A2X28_05400 [Elusimicrobia bacterium GWA2_56_46]OGR55704.1 MAG: hypothetical protein A2X39_00020 [Elusimicrobia bacterium GWC2_56_31]HBB67486.1 hypothetical protein [Elusimicrobiota bacterium]HBW23180.1 hypothetical protein [Elusimicrobiota bacterium]